MNQIKVAVKKTFFIGQEEAKKLNDPYIIYSMPHYLLEDNTILWAKSAWGGNDMGMTIWYEKARTPEDYQENGYGHQIDVMGRKIVIN